jgi:DNA processing protein
VIRGGIFEQFGDDDIQTVLESLGRPASEECSADDAFASALWSCLVEPGDAVGGVLREAFGPAGGLSALSLDDDDLIRQVARSDVAELSAKDIGAARARWAPRTSVVRFRSALRSARVLKVGLVVPGDSAWPGGVDDLGVHAPAAFWVRGDKRLLSRSPGVAIVGSRAATAYGEQVTAELVNALASRQIVIQSGGAYGIDGTAHLAALAAEGVTVAVLAGGVDRFYPAGNHDLLARVSTHGLVVSEMSCGTSPSRWRFLQRNRILAAMSAATVVVEAGARSGALNTASHARMLGRPLGAVPGPTTSPASVGCLRLIREADVTCVTGADDVVQMIEPLLMSDSWLEPGTAPSAEEVRLLDALTLSRPRREEQLAQISGLAESVVRATLAVLEMGGTVREREGGWVRCRTSLLG